LKPAGNDRTTLLVRDPGRPSKPVLAGRFIRSEIRASFRRLARALKIQTLQDAVPADWAIPDSAFARQATEIATTLCPEFMVRHCFRSYCFGAILASRNQLRLDHETFFVAAMLHDLGLSETHAGDPGSFEWVGAKLAHTISLDAEQSEFRAALIHNAIALHTSVGIAENCQPEIALLHFGTGMDLFGMRLDEIPRDVLERVLAEHPRSEFKAEFSPCLVHQAELKPDSQIAGAVGIGIVDRIQEHLIG
jgi:hypothetical protein